MLESSDELRGVSAGDAWLWARVCAGERMVTEEPRESSEVRNDEPGVREPAWSSKSSQVGSTNAVCGPWWWSGLTEAFDWTSSNVHRDGVAPNLDIVFDRV